uniref:Uncharacterized protein n=1 Tax=Romanomermis culicivorax TaxID=13658 RepID=A0A915ICC4_ROMCU
MAATYCHVAATYGPNISHANYHHTHHLAAAHGPDVGSGHHTSSTIIGYHYMTGTRSRPTGPYHAKLGTTFTKRGHEFAKLYAFLNNELTALYYAGVATLSASYRSVC